MEKELLRSFDEQDMENTGIPCSSEATIHLANPNAAGQPNSRLSTAGHIGIDRTSSKRKRQRSSRLSRRSISDENRSSLTHPGRGQIGRDQVNLVSDTSGMDESRYRNVHAKRTRRGRRRALKLETKPRLESETDSESEPDYLVEAEYLSEPEHLSEPEPDTVRTVSRRRRYTVDPSFNDEAAPPKLHSSDSISQIYGSQTRSSCSPSPQRFIPAQESTFVSESTDPNFFTISHPLTWTRETLSHNDTENLESRYRNLHMRTSYTAHRHILKPKIKSHFESKFDSGYELEDLCETEYQSESEYLSEPEPDIIRTISRRLKYTVDPSFNNETT